MKFSGLLGSEFIRVSGRAGAARGREASSRTDREEQGVIPANDPNGGWRALHSQPHAALVRSPRLPRISHVSERVYVALQEARDPAHRCAAF